MRTVTALCVCLSVAATGCRSAGLRSPFCEPGCDAPAAPVVPAGPTAQAAEVHQSPEVRVTAPAPKVIVNMPEPTVIQAPAAGGMAATGAVYSQPAFSQPAMVQQAAVAQPAVLGNTTQTVTPPRTRLALGFDTVQIRMPTIRFYPVTTHGGEVTTTTQLPIQQQQAAVSQPVMVQQPMQMVSQPAQVFQQPMQVVSQPAQVFQQPMQVMSQPAQVFQQPMQVVPQAAQVFQQPVQLVQQPTTSQPATAAAEVCPPVSKQTLDLLQAELERTKAVLQKVQGGK